MATETVSNNLEDVAMDVDIPEASLVEVIENTALLNSQNKVTLDKDIIVSESSSEVPAQTVNKEVKLDYRSIINKYPWDGCQKIELKNGHVLYLSLQKNFIRNVVGKIVIQYLETENPKRAWADVVRCRLRRLHGELKKLRKHLLARWEDLESLAKTPFLHCKLKKLSTSGVVVFQRGKPKNVEIVQVEECVKCLGLRGEMSNYRKNIRNLRAKLADTKQELSAVKKIYNIKRINQKIKRKNDTIHKCKKEKKKLRLENFSLQREVKRLKKKCESLMKKKKTLKKKKELGSTSTASVEKRTLINGGVSSVVINDEEGGCSFVKNEDIITSIVTDLEEVSSLISVSDKEKDCTIATKGDRSSSKAMGKDS